MARTYFEALDANGATIKIGAQWDAMNGIYTPISALGGMPRLDRFLDTNGDGTGTVNAIGNYAAAADDFYIEPGAAEHYHISQLSIAIEDNANFRAEFYDAVSAVANGVQVIRKQNAVETVMTLVPVTNQGRWGIYADRYNDITYGSGNNFVIFHWEFSNANVDLVLDGATNDQLIVRLNDDFSNLVSHYFNVQGHVMS